MAGKTRWMRTVPAVLLAAALVGLPATAWAEGSVGIVLEKDLERSTLSLDGGTVLQVTPSTVITGLAGQRITLADVPAAESADGGYAVDGDETIQYEASRKGRKLVATSIRLLDTSLD